MKNSSSKKKRVVGMILAFLMVFNLVVFTGQVGAFAGDTTSNGSITIDILTNFTEIKGIEQLENYRKTVSEKGETAKVVMIPEKYGKDNVILGLPAGSALVELKGLVKDSPVAETSDIEKDTSKIEHVYVPTKGKGFDTCDYGSIVYLSKDTTLTRRGNDKTMQGSYTLEEDAWFYNCSGSGVKNVGPFYIYSYETKTLEISQDDIVIKAKSTFTPSLKPGYINESDFEATITLKNEVIDKVINMSPITLDPTDNSVNPLKGDCTVTAVFGMGENVARKEVVAAVQLTSSDIRAKLITSKYSGTSSKTFTTDDVMVEYRVDDQWHETDEFELLDATVNPLNGDTTISISLAGVNKVVEAAKQISGNVSANGTTDIKELVQSVQTIQAKPNSVIANNSITAVKAAIDIMKSEKLNQYVTEAIDLGDANVIVKDDGTAAKLQAKVNTMDASVIANALTPEEIVKVLSGEKVDLRLEVVVDETSNAKETTGGQLIEKNLEANQNAYYFTADLFKIFNDNEDDKSSITEFADAISFTIDIPEELRSEGRAFTLIASHENADGTFETFELVDTDDDDTTFTASTTKLCTMALVYADEAVAETPIVEDPVIEPAYNYDVSPETADLRNILWAFIITVSAGAVLVVTFRKEFQ